MTGSKGSTVFWESCPSLSQFSESVEDVMKAGRGTVTAQNLLILREEKHEILLLAVSQMQKYRMVL